MSTTTTTNGGGGGAAEKVEAVVVVTAAAVPRATSSLDTGEPATKPEEVPEAPRRRKRHRPRAKRKKKQLRTEEEEGGGGGGDAAAMVDVPPSLSVGVASSLPPAGPRELDSLVIARADELPPPPPYAVACSLYASEYPHVRKGREALVSHLPSSHVPASGRSQLSDKADLPPTHRCLGNGASRRKVDDCQSKNLATAVRCPQQELATDSVTTHEVRQADHAIVQGTAVCCCDGGVSKRSRKRAKRKKRARVSEVDLCDDMDDLVEVGLYESDTHVASAAQPPGAPVAVKHAEIGDDDDYDPTAFFSVPPGASVPAEKSHSEPLQETAAPSDGEQRRKRPNRPKPAQRQRRWEARQARLMSEGVHDEKQSIPPSVLPPSDARPLQRVRHEVDEIHCGRPAANQGLSWMRPPLAITDVPERNDQTAKPPLLAHPASATLGLPSDAESQVLSDIQWRLEFLRQWGAPPASREPEHPPLFPPPPPAPPPSVMPPPEYARPAPQQAPYALASQPLSQWQASQIPWLYPEQQLPSSSVPQWPHTMHPPPIPVAAPTVPLTGRLPAPPAVVPPPLLPPSHAATSSVELTHNVSTDVPDNAMASPTQAPPSYAVACMSWLAHFPNAPLPHTLPAPGHLATTANMSESSDVHAARSIENHGSSRLALGTARRARASSSTSSYESFSSYESSQSSDSSQSLAYSRRQTLLMSKAKRKKSASTYARHVAKPNRPFVAVPSLPSTPSLPSSPTLSFREPGIGFPTSTVAAHTSRRSSTPHDQP